MNPEFLWEGSLSLQSTMTGDFWSAWSHLLSLPASDFCPNPPHSSAGTGLTSEEEMGGITLLDLLAVLCLIQPRISTLDTFSLGPLGIPTPFSAKPLSSMGLYLLMYRAFHFSLLDIPMSPSGAGVDDNTVMWQMRVIWAVCLWWFCFCWALFLTLISAVRQDDIIKIGDWPIFVLMDHREILFQGKRTMTEFMNVWVSGSEWTPSRRRAALFPWFLLCVCSDPK